jgi:dGTPase
VLYSSAFRRLGGVTQVVSAAEGDIFHNRLTHSLKVAQIGRRLAEKLAQDQLRRESTDNVQLDPDVVEAAGLAHDLGHPPFGHIAEDELNVLVGDMYGGFEGNPQTFRILTHLSVRSPLFGGLNLTRATLNATLKYPWFRDMSDARKRRKWGVYESETEEFEFARDGSAPDTTSAEADLMDWADDITYAVHDLEDFYRAGLLPLERLREAAERKRFLDEVFERWRLRAEPPRVSRSQAEHIAAELLGEAPFDEPFLGTRRQRATLRSWTAGLIGRSIDAATLGSSLAKPVEVDTRIRENIEILKQLTWHYVILNPALATQQAGQRRIIKELFAVYTAAANSGQSSWERKLVPAGFAEELQRIDTLLDGREGACRRLAADIIVGMTEQQAIETHHRLTGIESGSVMRTRGN